MRMDGNAVNTMKIPPSTGKNSNCLGAPQFCDYQVPNLWFSSRSAAARVFLCFICSAVAFCFTAT